MNSLRYSGLQEVAQAQQRAVCLQSFTDGPYNRTSFTLAARLPGQVVRALSTSRIRSGSAIPPVSTCISFEGLSHGVSIMVASLWCLIDKTRSVMHGVWTSRAMLATYVLLPMFQSYGILLTLLHLVLPHFYHHLLLWCKSDTEASSNPHSHAYSAACRPMVKLQAHTIDDTKQHRL